MPPNPSPNATKSPSPSLADVLGAASDATLAAELGAARLTALLALAAPDLEVREPEPLARLRAPADVCALSVAGAEYRVDADGCVAVPPSAVAAACDAGCVVVPTEAPADA